MPSSAFRESIGVLAVNDVNYMIIVPDNGAKMT
jgi:hypothetical protein